MSDHLNEAPPAPTSCSAVNLTTPRTISMSVTTYRLAVPNPSSHRPKTNPNA